MAIKKEKKVAKEAIPEKISHETPAIPEESREEKITRTASTATEEEKGEDTDVDYLLKYQYGRELPLGDVRTNPAGGKAKAMKDSLLVQGRVRVLIPVDSGSDPSVPFSVCLNGYRLDLPRNQYIDVPQQVAEVIMNSHSQTVRALEQFKIGGNKAKEDALSQ